MGSCCKHLAVRSFALEVRCSCKPPPKQMLSSVLTSKGKVLTLNFHPPRSRAWVRGGDPSEDQLPAPPIPSSSTKYRSSHQHPGLAEEADLSWQLPQGLVLRPCLDVIAGEPGAQDPDSPQATQIGWGRGGSPGPMQTDGCRHLVLEKRMGKRHCLIASAWPAGSCGEGSGALQNTAPSLSPGTPSSPPAKVKEGPGEKAVHLSLTKLSLGGHHPANGWPSGTSKATLRALC